MPNLIADVEGTAFIYGEKNDIFLSFIYYHICSSLHLYVKHAFGEKCQTVDSHIQITVVVVFAKV